MMQIPSAVNPLVHLFTGFIIATFVLTLTGCTPAVFGRPSLAIEVQSAVSSGNVSAYLVDGTVILSGRVDSYYDAMAAERAAIRYEGIDQVINHIYVIR